MPTVSASQNQAVLTAASAAASSSVQTLVAAAAGQHADGQVSATTSNVARVSGKIFTGFKPVFKRLAFIYELLMYRII